MNNLNFADWEITEKLPLYNVISYESESQFLIKNLETGIVSLKTTDYYDPSETYDEVYSVRHAYTWEDIRLYLLGKGYEIYVGILSNMPNKPVWYDANIFYNNEEKYEYNEVFTTYEEARKSAILYVLDLINNE